MAWSADDYTILFFFVVGALLHGITGFGYPIVGTAVVAGFYPLKVAVAMVVVPCIVMNVVMLHSGAGFWRNVAEYGRAFLPLFVSSFVGGLIGVKLLLVFPEPALKMFLGGYAAVLCGNAIQPFSHSLWAWAGDDASIWLCGGDCGRGYQCDCGVFDDLSAGHGAQ